MDRFWSQPQSVAASHSLMTSQITFQIFCSPLPIRDVFHSFFLSVKSTPFFFTSLLKHLSLFMTGLNLLPAVRVKFCQNENVHRFCSNNLTPPVVQQCFVQTEVWIFGLFSTNPLMSCSVNTEDRESPDVLRGD